MACPVCFSSEDSSRIAYYITTALLTVMPFFLLGGLFFFIRSRVRQMEEESPEKE